MVVELKFVAVIVVGMLLSIGGVSLVQTELPHDTEAPVSRVLPMQGLFYIKPNREPIRVMVNNMDCGPSVDCQFPSSPLASQAMTAAVELKAEYIGDDGVEVRWAGHDGQRGSGVRYFDVQVRYEGGEWEDWQVLTESNTDMYYPQAEGNYVFRSRATDWAGNVEEYPAEADAGFMVEVYHPGENIEVPDHPIPNPDYPDHWQPCPPGAFCAWDEEG